VSWIVFFIRRKRGSSVAVLTTRLDFSHNPLKRVNKIYFLANCSRPRPRPRPRPLPLLP